MASSERPGDRDDAVPPDPEDPDPSGPETQDQDDGSRSRGPAEPDRGSASRRHRVRVVGECLYWLIRLLLDLYGNGG
ncbi:hypothetical protein AB0D27_29900 [Streptomyces sp. NPDC048415]|uniref:hypothetical protein n=1 Tax=Streptomyces sp. NPDC048415 TaxID=3154822 RepID=UPI003421B0C4